MNLVLAYLSSFERNELQHLYSHSVVTRAVLQSLGALAQQYAMRLLFAGDADGGGGVPLASVERWVRDGASSEHEQALRRLLELGVAQRRDVAQQPRGPAVATLALTEVFARALASDVCEPSVAVSGSNRGVAARTLQSVQQHARTRWDALVGLLVGVSGEIPREDVVSLMLESGLLRLTAHDSLKISNQGFQFLLQPKPAQLWTLLMAHLEALGSDAHRRHLLSLLFRLAALPAGTRLTTAAIAAEHTDVAVGALAILDGLGIVQWDEAGGALLVSPLAALLTGSAESAAVDDGYIVLETNFRLYAYTTSMLDIAVICLFTQPLVRLPNLAVGIVTRDSVRQALMAGITADQILQYVRVKAHPALKAETAPVVPVAVAEQVALWATERARVHCDRAAMYTFPDDATYQRALAEAQLKHVHLHSSASRRSVVVVRGQGEAVMRELFRI
jgi:transcription initiation factor TFIIH subunit 4